MFICTRQIDINARFGLPRLAFLGFVTTIISFLICYEIMHYYSNEPLTDHYFYFSYSVRSCFIRYTKCFIYYFYYRIINLFAFIRLIKEGFAILQCLREYAGQ